MTKRLSFQRFALAALALPLALGLAACGKKEGEAAAPSSDPVAKVAPPAGKAWSDIVVQTEDGGYLMGNPEAPIKLIEYGSLTCPHCAKFAQESYHTLVNDFVGSGRVSYEFRSFAIHPQDIPLTALVRCSSKEAFFPLVDQIYANFDAMNSVLQDKSVEQRANAAMQSPPPQRFVQLAEALGYLEFFAQRGIAVDQARGCLGNATEIQKIADYSQKYSENGINSTPTLVLNGSKLGTNQWSEVRVALENAGAR